MNIFRRFSVMLDTVLSSLNLVLRNNRNAIFAIMGHFVLFSVGFNFEGEWRLVFFLEILQLLLILFYLLWIYLRETLEMECFRIFGTTINVRTTDLSSVFKRTKRCNLYVYYSIVRYYAGRKIC